MSREGGSGFGGPSKREIVAAWACCGLVMLGAVLAEVGRERSHPANAVFAGVHIPGGGGQRQRRPEAAPDSDETENPVGDIGTLSNPDGTVAIGSAETPANSEPARRPERESRFCWRTLLQSGIRYSAGARLAEAGAGSAARDATQ